MAELRACLLVSRLASWLGLSLFLARMLSDRVRMFEGTVSVLSQDTLVASGLAGVLRGGGVSATLPYSLQSGRG